jgi:hypothetical protein
MFVYSSGPIRGQESRSRRSARMSRSQRRRLVQAAYVQFLCVGEHRLLLALRFACSLLRQLRRQAAQLPYAGGIDEDTARGKNRDALYPPLLLPDRGKSGPDPRCLEWVRWGLDKLVAFLDSPFMEFRYRPLQWQIPYIVNRQPGTPAVAETASVGDQRGRPQRQRHNPVPVLLGSSQFREEPLTAVHDELKILNSGRLVGENPG